MAADDTPQDPTIEKGAVRRSADQWDTPEPPAPGTDGDHPVQESAAVHQSADQWDVPAKPGDNVKDPTDQEGDASS